MILFFDTETSGLPRKWAPLEDPNRPHIVQLAAILTDDSGAVQDSCNLITKPEGWEIPKQASDIHGITQEIALRDGVPEKEVSARLLELGRRSEMLCGHNLDFDKLLALIMFNRFEGFTKKQSEGWMKFKSYCTMRVMTPVCKIPSPYREGEFKWPKLQEAYTHAFGKPFDGAHNALADVEACRDVYFWIRKTIDLS